LFNEKKTVVKGDLSEMATQWLGYVGTKILNT